MPHYIPAGEHHSRGKPRGAGRTIDAPERPAVIDERPGPWRRPLPLLWGCREAWDVVLRRLPAQKRGDR